MADVSPAVAGILEALRLNQARRNAQVQAGLERSRIINAREQEEKNREERAREHDDLIKYNELVQKATDALQKVHASQTRYNILKGYTTEGIPIPDSQVLSEQTTPEGYTYQDIQLPSYLGTEDKQVPGIIGNVPMPMIAHGVETPGSRDKRELAYKASLNQQVIDREAQKQAELLAREKQKEADKAAADLKKAQEEIAGRQKVAEINASARRYAANQTAARAGAEGVENVDSYVQGLENLQYSGNDIKRLFPKQATTILNAATNQGLVIPSEDQKKLIGLFSSAVGPAFTAYNDFLNLTKNGPQDLINPLNLLRAKQGQAQVTESLVSAANAVGQGRLSDRRVEAVRAAYSPNILDSPANNQLRANRYRDYLRTVLTAKTLGLSDRQSRHVQESLGLWNNPPNARYQQRRQNPQTGHTIGRNFDLDGNPMKWYDVVTGEPLENATTTANTSSK